MTTLTADQINAATTKQLQGYTAELTGKPCTNRNAKAMKARLLKELDRIKPEARGEEFRTLEEIAFGDVVAHAPGKSPFGEGPSEPQIDAPKRKGKKVKTDKPADKPKAARADKGVNRKPRATPVQSQDNRLHTKHTLADLPADTWLVHNFRGGEAVRVKVVEPIGKDGKGGVFTYKNKKYNGLKGLRQITIETSGIAWNVLMYFRREDTGELLQPYPKHKKREPVQAETKATA